jgi:acetate kinase
MVADALDRHSGSPARSTWGTCSRRPNLGDDDAALALDVWAHLARALVATMAAAMDGLDVLAFSGGVGEHRPALRHPLRGGSVGLGRRTA